MTQAPSEMFQAYTKVVHSSMDHEVLDTLPAEFREGPVPEEGGTAGVQQEGQDEPHLS
jgi:hypothetical protein